MTVTIKDVAAHAGVSPKTVSRVMNGEAHVRDAVRETVERAVAELGYRPNAFARSLSSARSYLIGLFFDDPASGYAVSMQRGALESCRQRHYHLVVEALDLKQADWREELAASLGSLRLDGVVLTPPLSQHPDLLTLLRDRDLPFVTVSPDPAAEPAFGSVDIDERQAAFDMTSRLIALGHRDVGFIEGAVSHASTAARRAGFVAAMTAQGLSIAPGRVQCGDFSFRSGMEAAEALLTETPRPTAIFASNDDMALGVSVVALKLGLRVPDDLSVAGFDDAPTARLAWPPITTVRQPVAELGSAAVTMLLDATPRGGANRVGQHVRLRYDIVERASTRAPGVPPAGDGRIDGD